MTLMSDERLSESMRAAIARRISEGLSNETEAVHLLHSLNLAEAEICRLRAERDALGLPEAPKEWEYSAYFRSPMQQGRIGPYSTLAEVKLQIKFSDEYVTFQRRTMAGPWQRRNAQGEWV